jgi:hypothetical protein
MHSDFHINLDETNWKQNTLAIIDQSKSEGKQKIELPLTDYLNQQAQTFNLEVLKQTIGTEDYLRLLKPAPKIRTELTAFVDGVYPSITTEDIVDTDDEVILIKIKSKPKTGY